MKNETIDAAAAAASKLTLAGAVGGFWGWLTANGTLGLIGACVAIGGMAINWYYKREANRRLIAEHELRQRERQMRIDLMRATGRPIPHDSDLGALEADE